MKSIIKLLFTIDVLLPVIVCAEPSKPTKKCTTLPTTDCINYVSLGLTGPGYMLVCPDIALGHRRIAMHHALDLNVGVLALPSRPWGQGLLYAQASYLYYFRPYREWYLGCGLAAGVHNVQIFESNRKGSTHPWINMPLTCGYHFHNDHFVQLQVTPWLTATLSYGIPF
jgi:hypothetical protein